MIATIVAICLWFGTNLGTIFLLGFSLAACLFILNILANNNYEPESKKPTKTKLINIIVVVSLCLIVAIPIVKIWG